MKKQLLLLITLILALAMGQLTAQVRNGTYRALTATNSARVAALGGMPLPMHDGDLQTVTFNPSAITDEMSGHATLSYVGDFHTHIHFGTVQYARSFEKFGNFAATLQYHNYGNFDYASEGGVTDGSAFNVSDYAMTIGWGRQLTDKWSIGANLKYAGLQYESYQAGALAVDVAGGYITDSKWALSLTARNIGMQLFSDFDAERFLLPFSLDFTASKQLEHLPFTFVFGYNDIQRWNKLYDEYLPDDNGNLVIDEEEQKPNAFRNVVKNLACHFVIGGELNIGKNLVLRAAYNYGRHYDMDVPDRRSLTGFSAGFGVKVKMFEIDYALSRNNIVGSPHFLTIRVDLNKF